MSPKASSKGANPLLEVDADVITAAPTKVLSHFLMLTKDIHTPSGQTKPNLTHLCETCQPSPLQAGGRDTPLALKSPRSNSAIASRAPPIIRVGQLSSVAKSDDAGVNKAIWNDRVWIPLRVSESIIQQCTVLLHACPLDIIRAGLLGRWRRGITLDLLLYLRKEHGSRWSTNPLALRDKEVGRQCLHHVAGADWWEWKAGSTLLFWRWPERHRKLVRDGHKIWVKSDLPSYLRPQPNEKDRDVREKVALKLRNVVDKGYVGKGTVTSLTSFFSVPKGDQDIRMVYDASKSGLNASL